MSDVELSLIAGSILSLVFSYVPGLSGKFDQLVPEYKRAIMLGCVLIVAAGAYALACAGLGESLGLAITCNVDGALALVRSVILVAVANQGTYKLTNFKS